MRAQTMREWVFTLKRDLDDAQRRVGALERENAYLWHEVNKRGLLEEQAEAQELATMPQHQRLGYYPQEGVGTPYPIECISTIIRDMMAEEEVQGNE